MNSVTYCATPRSPLPPQQFQSLREGFKKNVQRQYNFPFYHGNKTNQKNVLGPLDMKEETNFFSQNYKIGLTPPPFTFYTKSIYSFPNN